MVILSDLSLTLFWPTGLSLYFLPCPAEEGSDQVASMGTWHLARVNPTPWEKLSGYSAYFCFPESRGWQKCKRGKMKSRQILNFVEFVTWSSYVSALDCSRDCCSRTEAHISLATAPYHHIAPALLSTFQNRWVLCKGKLAKDKVTHWRCLTHRRHCKEA